MGRFSQVKNSRNKLKNELLDKILSNQDLLKYIYYPSENPLDQEDIDNPTDLLKTHIYTKPKIVETIIGEQSYLILHINYKKNNQSLVLKDFQVAFDILCHDNLEDNLLNGDDRLFCIAEELDNMFNGKTGQNWVCKSEQDTENFIYINDKFTGFRVIYNFSKFN